ANQGLVVVGGGKRSGIEGIVVGMVGREGRLLGSGGNVSYGRLLGIVGSESRLGCGRLGMEGIGGRVG
ncbi:uncharacterized protein LOC110810718, partial [Carica papaya]|uniref:uncharacterized protein LOC110810718 n=1 Tax=Carica papaya TaxID=3649 RepID=UPI000B8CA440